MPGANVRIVEGVSDQNLSAALLIAYESFSEKFRLGFRNSDDFLKLFRDSADRSCCYTAVVDGQLLGFLAFKTNGREFFELNLLKIFTRFSPWRAIRILCNLLLHAERDPKQSEFVVDAVAISEVSRGLGLGTSLMQRAEDRARGLGKSTMRLQVIGDNTGAIRLYQRMGYGITRTQRGFLVRLASGSSEVFSMEKSLSDE